MTEPKTDPVEALKDIRTLLRIAAESDDPSAIQKHIEMALVIIGKALPRRKQRPTTEEG